MCNTLSTILEGYYVVLFHMKNHKIQLYYYFNVGIQQYCFILWGADVGLIWMLYKSHYSERIAFSQEKTINKTLSTLLTKYKTTIVSIQFLSVQGNHKWFHSSVSFISEAKICINIYNYININY